MTETSEPTDSPAPDDAEERALIEAARGGDRAAQDELLGRHLPGLNAFVRLRSSRMLRERESCSDLAQSACRMALQDLGRFEYRGAKSFRNWLLTYATNRMRNKEQFHRAERRSPANEREVASLSQFYATVTTPSRVADSREQVEAFERAFDRLPDDYREVVMLARIQGLSHAEIAAQLGCTEGASRKLLSRALVRLASLLASDRS